MYVHFLVMFLLLATVAELTYLLLEIWSERLDRRRFFWKAELGEENFLTQFNILVQMLRKIMMQVISSIEVSSSYQRLIASFIMASAAFSAEFWR